MGLTNCQSFFLYTSGYDGDYIQGLLALLSLTYVKYYTARIMPKMYYRQKKFSYLSDRYKRKT